ncbi:MAG: ribonuclease HII [Azospirillaceae bacterium]|nr:ribonuclease HII [Azospirillaceae bacterium]
MVGWDRARAGVDEVGRGSCFGPVVTCAVVFPDDGLDPVLAAGLGDSKVLSRRTREDLADQLCRCVRFAFGAASAAEVDAVNPLQATMRAMARAIERLDARMRNPRVPLRYVIVDGRDYPPVTIPGETVIKGDALVAEISAASILAKVFRDRLVARMATRYPGYGLERHAGYGTAAHFAAIARLGPTPHHRQTFLRKLNARLAAL